MLYLFGDSTESNLDFNFLAFLGEVIDASVVLADSEVLLAATIERRRIRQLEADALVAAVEDFGRRATLVVAPVAKDQTATPVGRCAASIATAIREAVDREGSQVRGALAAERDELDREDQRLQGRAKDAVEKLLRTHDLPGADKEIRVLWTAGGVKATMRQRTSFGVEAVLGLDIPSSSVLAPDLRVDRIAEGVEVHAFEAGGWLKKSDKLVVHKLGRYHVVSVTVGPQVTVQLRASADPSAAGFAVTSHPNGDLSLESIGGGQPRELAIDDRHRPGMRLLTEKLEAAARSLGDSRSGLVSIEIDSKPLSEHGHPRVLAERLVLAVAPTVQNIAKHSRSPGELVLRRLLGGNRREEIFVPIPELLRRLDGLPATARTVFAPLQLEGEAPVSQEPKPAPVAAGEPRSSTPHASTAPAPHASTAQAPHASTTTLSPPSTTSPSTLHGSSAGTSMPHASSATPSTPHASSTAPSTPHASATSPSTPHGSSAGPSTPHASSTTPSTPHASSTSPSTSHGSAAGPSTPPPSSTTPSTPHASSTAPLAPHAATAPEPRSPPSRTSPPVTPPERQRPTAPPPEVRRVTRPVTPPTFDLESDESPFLSAPRPAPAASDAKSPAAPARLAAVIIDESLTEPQVRRRTDDAALSNAIDVALDDDEGMPSVK